MPEHITSFYDLYNRANDAGKATDIQPDDLFILQRGTGSNRNKCIKGSDMLMANSNVVVDNSDNNPTSLVGKFYDVGSPIGVAAVTVGSGRYIVIGIKHGAVDTVHIKDSAVASDKINNGAVTNSKIADNAVDKDKIAAGAVFGAALNTFIVHKNESVQVASEATKTKVCDFVAVNKMGIIDVTVETDYSGAGNVPSGVTLSIEDTSGHELVSWSVNGGGSIAGKFTKRLVAKQSNSIPDAQMLSLYVSNGSISYGWTLGVVADGIIIY